MRGSIVMVAIQGDYGKPRPAVIIQSDYFDQHPSATLLPITSELRDTPLFRVDVPPTASTGLVRPSQVMVDKAITVPMTKIGEKIGQLAPETLIEVTRRLSIFLGIAP